MNPDKSLLLKSVKQKKQFGVKWVIEILHKTQNSWGVNFARGPQLQK